MLYMYESHRIERNVGSTGGRKTKNAQQRQATTQQLYFRPLLTSTIMFVHESWEGKGEHKKVWRMRRRYKRFSFCVESAPCCFFFKDGYDDWMWISIKSESLGRFHVASCWMENNLKLNKAPFSFPCDDCVERLTHFRTGPRLLGTHTFSWHTFSCSPSLSGFSWQCSHSPIYLYHHLRNVFACRQSRNWLKEGSWGSQPTWACGFD